MRISSSFDSGAIEVVSMADAEHIRLRLRADNAAEFRQWFHFRLHGAAGIVSPPQLSGIVHRLVKHTPPVHPPVARLRIAVAE